MNRQSKHKIEVYETLDSTNEYVKQRRGEGENLIVVARSQTGGKGTKGRSFSSKTGGVYLSKLTFHQHLPAKRAFEVMAGAAVAVCKTLESFGVTPQIKWPNDVFVNDKKICGILIENTFSGQEIACSIVGIGINVNNSLPQELQDIATTLSLQTGKTQDVDCVRNRLIAELEKPCDMDAYLKFIAYMGRQAMLLMGEKSVMAKLLHVDREGGLHVEIGGEEKVFTAAEISVRI